MRAVRVILLLLLSSPAFSQERELFSVLAEDTTFCAETTSAVADTSCGEIFLTHHGRLSWPALVNEGPVTLRIKAHRSGQHGTTLPLYIQLDKGAESALCETAAATSTIITTITSAQCGGAWESFGPLELSYFGIPLGSLYRVQLLAIATPPHELGQLFSVGLSQLQIVAAPTTVAGSSWTRIKLLYR